MKTKLKPHPIRDYELIKDLLERVKLDQSPEGRRVLTRLKGPADKAQAKLDAPRKDPDREAWEKAHEAALTALSTYIRTRDTQEVAPGVRRGKCATCPAVKDYKELSCGHWIRREYWGTKFHVQNNNAQCWGCNSKHMGNGREKEHEEFIRNKYGQGVIDRLLFLKKVEARQKTTEDLRRITAELTRKWESLP